MRLRGSIFFKLFGILIITGVLVNFIVYFALRFFANDSRIKRDVIEDFSRENLRAYVVQIGYPPDLEKMQFIAQQTGAEIRVEDGAQVWQTSDDLVPIAIIEKQQRKERGHRKDHRHRLHSDETRDKDSHEQTSELKEHSSILHHRGPEPKRFPVFFDVFSKPEIPPAFVLTEGTAKYAFFLPDRRDFAGRYGRLMIPLLLLLTFLIASAFFAIRYILLPVNSLMKGVEAVAQGDLDYRVQNLGGAEFATLGDSFNHMVDRIKETMEAKERLLIDVSHELQSPLARMKLAIELMKEEKAKERLRVNLKDIETMVAEILESARLDSSTGALIKQKSNVLKLVKEFMHVYEAMGSAVYLHFDSGKDENHPDWTLMIDPSRFLIVLRNLIENALKYADAQEKRVDVFLKVDDGFLRVEVKDNGRKIDSDELNKLFEPFYRIDKSRTRSTGGYGLGLSLCKRIVDAHQGEIGIESKESGTSVHFTLPRT